jgi:hypothetical protein
VENRISRLILDGGLAEGDSVHVDAKDGQLDFEVTKASGEAQQGAA